MTTGLHVHHSTMHNSSLPCQLHACLIVVQSHAWCDTMWFALLAFGLPIQYYTTDDDFVCLLMYGGALYAHHM